MKKIVLSLFVVFIAGWAIAQPAERQKVVVEIGTGTWCGFCPGAAMGAQDLIDNGHDVAIIKYHVGDAFANSFSNYRANYYGFSGYPTTKFDGVLTHVGGSSNNSIYPTYLPLYNQRIEEPSPFTIEMNVEHLAGLNFEANVQITNVSDFTSSNLVLHLVVTETDIPFTWFNQTHVKDVTRLMVPNQNGTSLDFSDKTEISVDLTFALQSAWVPENMSVVAFVQDVPTKEIFQGEVIPLMEIEYYMLTLLAEPEEGGTVSGEGEFGSGEEIQVNATPNEGWVFVNWTDLDGEVVSEEAESTITMPGEDLTLIANFEEGAPETFEVVFNVMDEDGEAIEDAVVTFNGDTHQAGEYTMPEVEAGTYTYSVSRDGYHTAEGSVEVDENVTVDVTLEQDVTQLTSPESLSLNIYPNPARNELNVETDGEITTLRLANLMGQVVYHTQVNASSYTINVSGLNPGIYFVQIHSNRGVTTHRIQVSR